MDWKRLLAYITGSVDQELLRRNESLVTENRLLRQQIKWRIQFNDAERQTLAEIGKKRADGTTGLVTTCQTINRATSCRREKWSGRGLGTEASALAAHVL